MVYYKGEKREGAREALRYYSKPAIFVKYYQVRVRREREIIESGDKLKLQLENGEITKAFDGRDYSRSASNRIMS